MQTASPNRSSTTSIILGPFTNMHIVAARESTENYVSNREYFVKRGENNKTGKKKD
jgi:hypothetical protein